MRPFYLSSLFYSLCRKWSAAFFDSLGAPLAVKRFFCVALAAVALLCYDIFKLVCPCGQKGAQLLGIRFRQSFGCERDPFPV